MKKKSIVEVLTTERGLRAFDVTESTINNIKDITLNVGDIILGNEKTLKQITEHEGEMFAVVVTSKGLNVFCIINPLKCTEDEILCTFPSLAPLPLRIQDIAAIYQLTNIVMKEDAHPSAKGAH